MQLRGRQTQFYIDLLYGLGFAMGFGYLLFVGMNPLVAAFQSGLVLGYFLRVWENMSIYERILHEEVAAEAEAVVADEIEDTMPGEVEEAVAETVEGAVAEEAEDAVPEEVTAEVEKQVAEEMADEIKQQVGEEMEERLAGADERVPEHVRKRREEQRSQLDDAGDGTEEATARRPSDRGSSGQP
ncbi:hypothetical protein [Salinibacter altiplanensis]|uniref:hypothetical protein n=1 Tax=Salinibacter altiplanensis TaxID=1803181 RepID=UPI000C9FE131|nr:hypothetical protein [Salinibacter altiplanensis]